MGKRLDALLGRSFKATKFKGTASLAVSRLAVLKNQRHARCSVARSDVVQFLTNAAHDRALLRVEQVIKEQNMLDVFVVLEGYCHLLVERINLFEHNKFCPEELLEAVSTLIFASTRCGDFPELQELRAIFTTRFGREFAARAIELRNNCGVNPKIIQKLSTRMPSLETKIKVLKEIASDNNIQFPVSDPLLRRTTLKISILETWKPTPPTPLGHTETTATAAQPVTGDSPPVTTLQRRTSTSAAISNICRIGREARPVTGDSPPITTLQRRTSTSAAVSSFR